MESIFNAFLCTHGLRDHAAPTLPLPCNLATVMKLKLVFLGTLYYARTKKILPSAFEKPALAECVARLIGNGKVPVIEVTSMSA